jgi:glycine hydroxymethyltransferase
MKKTKIEELLELENARQNNNIELIASENFTSKKVREITGSILTNKYAEGFPGRRYYGGCEYVDHLEELSNSLACKLYGCKFANLQPHSGSTANMIAFAALLKPGDKIMSLSLDEGGHLTHGSSVNFSGKMYNFIHYHIDDTGRIDYAAMEELARKEKPNMILAGFSAYPFIIDFERFGKIAKEVGAIFLVDMAHISGLVAAKVHPSPFPWADIVTSTTHKTIRGPRGGMILTNSEEVIKKVNSATFPGMQGGPLEHVIAAKGQAFTEALDKSFKKYAKQVLINTKFAAKTLKKLGATVTDTENHLFLLDTKKSFGLTGVDAQNKLDDIQITVNKNMLPKDPEKPSVTSGVRIGFAAITTRGADKKQSIEIATIIYKYLSNKINKDEALKLVNKITKKLTKVEEL